MLSKFYQCPEFNWPWPVCAAYGDNIYCPQMPKSSDGWALVHIYTSPQHVGAIPDDPRVIYCGKEWDTPPKQVLDTYADVLDPKVTYMFMGQVIARLAQQEPAYYHNESD